MLAADSAAGSEAADAAPSKATSLDAEKDSDIGGDTTAVPVRDESDERRVGLTRSPASEVAADEAMVRSQGTAVLVTGAAGFIGRHLVSRLLAQGEEVIALDVREIPGAGTRLRTVTCDLRDRTALTAELAGCGRVVHLAATSDPRGSAGSREADVQHGIVATWNLLEAMVAAGVPSITFASSQHVYGPTVGTVTERTGPLLPANLYGASKLACEGLLSSYALNFGLEVTICRLANVIGPGLQRSFVSDVIRRLRTEPDRLEILGDGTNARSYLYIDDCLDAMTLLPLVRAHACDLYCVGTIDTVTARRAAEICVDEMGFRGRTEIVCSGPRSWPGDPGSVAMDSSRARDAGWAPAWSSEEALRATARALALVSALPA